MLNWLRLKEYYYTIADIFAIFDKNNDRIDLLSHNVRDKSVKFERMHKIWKSGIKIVYTLTTKSGKSVRASEDHLFFVNGQYLPIKDVSTGDIVVCLSDGDSGMYEDSVLSIEQDKAVETFDIEVPSTENFFANGIKCHNSRWFRYLFKAS